MDAREGEIGGCLGSSVFRDAMGPLAVSYLVALFCKKA